MLELSRLSKLALGIVNLNQKQNRRSIVNLITIFILIIILLMNGIMWMR